MESITKRHLSVTEIDALAARAFPGTGVVSFEELTDGWFSGCLRARARRWPQRDPQGHAARRAAPARLRDRAHATEIEFYERAHTAGVPVPELLFHDVSRDLIDSVAWAAEHLESDLDRLGG